MKTLIMMFLFLIPVAAIFVGGILFVLHRLGLITNAPAMKSAGSKHVGERNVNIHTASGGAPVKHTKLSTIDIVDSIDAAKAQLVFTLSLLNNEETLVKNFRFSASKANLALTLRNDEHRQSTRAIIGSRSEQSQTFYSGGTKTSVSPVLEHA
jgi:hypothetical protein